MLGWQVAISHCRTQMKGAAEGTSADEVRAVYLNRWSG